MNMIDLYANEYKEEHWKIYVKGFESKNINVNGISEDIVNAVLSILGIEEGLDWLNKPLSPKNQRRFVEKTDSIDQREMEQATLTLDVSLGNGRK